MDGVDEKVKTRTYLQRGDREAVVLKDGGKIFQGEETGSSRT